MSATDTERAHRWPLLALSAIMVVTVGWWAAALWPLPPATPDWVVRARTACFGSTPSGLPNSGGWVLLIGTPPSMLAALWLISGSELTSALCAVRRARGGQMLLRSAAMMLLVLTGLAGARVAAAKGVTLAWGGASEVTAPPLLAGSLDSARPAPELGLLDQHGEIVHLEEFRGRPVLVTFAYGKCETVCPVLVHNVLAARSELADVDPAVVVMTLDPWRDTPGRLIHIAAEWGMTGDGRVLGGSIETVEAALDRWGVERFRDPRTGEISHASLAYVLDREGRVTSAVTGSSAQIVAAVRRLDQEG